MPCALLSVSNKTGIVDFARGLAALGFDLVSTGGTAAALSAAGLHVLGVSELTGFPEMLDGRVKTLHPHVHAGILARRSDPEHVRVLAQLGIGLIDLVAVNLYPFSAAAADPTTSPDDLIEQIDVGGPTMVRASAKSFADVLIVVDPNDYAQVLAALGGATVDMALRLALARKAFAHTARYDALIAATLGELEAERDGVRDGVRRHPGRVAPAFSDELSLGLHRIRDVRYGENPHQRAAWYGDGSGAGLGRAEVLQGKELSYTNLLDLDAAWRIALEFAEPVGVVIKHTNPCGVATGTSAADAYERARAADALSAFGGIVGLNRAVDAAAATVLTSTFIEAVIAPDVLDEARPILAAKSNLRVVRARFEADRAASATLEARSILGGMLVQQRDSVVEAQADWSQPEGRPDTLSVVTERQPTAAEWQALRFAWRVCAHVKSNAVIFTDRTATRAVGAGQMSRVDAVNVAVAKAGGALAGTVAASDAFFPFRDGLDAVARAGATAVVQPGGSVRDADVIAAANEHGLAMVFTGRRHFRH